MDKELEPLTLATGAIFDEMAGRKIDWQNASDDLLESADWLTAQRYAKAALATRTPAATADHIADAGKMVANAERERLGYNLHDVFASLMLFMDGAAGEGLEINNIDAADTWCAAVAALGLPPTQVYSREEILTALRADHGELRDEIERLRKERDGLRGQVIEECASELVRQYNLNDCDERHPDDALEISVRDLRALKLALTQGSKT